MTTTTDALIGRRVAKALAREHISQSELARRISMGQPMLSAKIGGKRRWYADEVVRVSAALSVESDQLMPTLVDVERAMDVADQARPAIEAIRAAEESTGMTWDEIVALARTQGGYDAHGNRVEYSNPKYADVAVVHPLGLEPRTHWLIDCGDPKPVAHLFPELHLAKAS